MTKNVARIVATCVWIFNAGIILWMVFGFAQEQHHLVLKINALEDRVTDLQTAIRGNAIQSDYVLQATERNKEAIRELQRVIPKYKCGSADLPTQKGN